jgi:type IV pilus biogenesis protein CpaD/CtpE
MRLNRPASTILLALATTALLAGCTSKASDQGASGTSADTGMAPGMAASAQPEGGMAAFVGTHQTTQGNTMKVDSDGSFTVSTRDSVFVHGHATASGDTITITDDVCAQPGVYVVHAGPNGPRYTLVSDACNDRRADLTGDTTATGGQ